MEYAQFREIRTRRLVLRKLCLEDARDYYDRLSSSETVTKYMLFMPHRDFSEAVASMEKTLRRYAEGKCYRWGIAQKEDGRIIGVIDLLRFDEKTETCSFAYMLGEAFWGRGFATEALQAVIGFAFRELKLAAIEADHMADNAASGAVMRKAGMEYQRTDRAKYTKDGKIYNAPVYRICADAWEKGIS